jgi:hypothetical protein
MEIVMVLTSHDVVGNAGKKTGLWLKSDADVVLAGRPTIYRAVYEAN